MSRHHRKILHAIFAYPVNANLDLKDVTFVLTGLGAEMDANTSAPLRMPKLGWLGVLD